MCSVDLKGLVLAKPNTKHVFAAFQLNVPFHPIVLPVRSLFLLQILSLKAQTKKVNITLLNDWLIDW